jgi:hypothetical protein
VDALGALRESLSALGNLEGLLRSLKVSPKAVSAVLPDVLGDCQPLLASLTELRSEFGSLDDHGCLIEIEQSVRGANERLQEVLASAKRPTLNASTRLRAQVAVAAAVRELGATLPLLELLKDIKSASGTVNWVEALWLSRSGDQSPSPGGLAVDVVVNAEGEAPIAGLLPRAALNMVRLGAALVLEKGSPLRVAFEKRQDLHLLVIDRTPSEGHRVRLLIPREVNATKRCLQAAAAALNLSLSLNPDSTVMSWKDQPSAASGQ